MKMNGGWGWEMLQGCHKTSKHSEYRMERAEVMKIIMVCLKKKVIA